MYHLNFLHPFKLGGWNVPPSNSNFIYNMETSVNFTNATSLASFKAAQNDSPMNIIKSPKTDKMFFSCGTVTGAVSAKIDFDGQLQVSTMEVIGEDGDIQDTFMILHNVNVNNVVRTL